MCTRIQLSNQHISLERCHPPLFVLLLFFSFVPLHPAQHGNDILSAISDTVDFSMMAETQLSEFTSRSKSAVCPSIASLVSSYPILTALAFHLSILDRYHLGLTSGTHYNCILASLPIFKKLSFRCL